MIKSPIAVLSLLIPAVVAMYVCGAVGVWYVWMVIESVVWLRGDGVKSGQVFTYHRGDKLKKRRSGGFRMNRELNNKAVCDTDPDYAGLPLAPAFSEHPGVVGLDVVGYDHRLKR